MTTIDNTTKHSILVQHGWRMALDGRWRSPNPDDARFSSTLAAAWAIHTARQDQPEGD